MKCIKKHGIIFFNKKEKVVDNVYRIWYYIKLMRKKCIESKEVIRMTEAKVVMDRFMERLGNNEFEKENQPNNGPEISLDFIDAQLQSYSKLLKSGIVEAALLSE